MSAYDSEDLRKRFDALLRADELRMWHENDDRQRRAREDDEQLSLLDEMIEGQEKR